MDNKANDVLILNITHIETKNPTSEMYQRERKVGRYDGEEPKWFKNEIKHKAP